MVATKKTSGSLLFWLAYGCHQVGKVGKCLYVHHIPQVAQVNRCHCAMLNFSKQNHNACDVMWLVIDTYGITIQIEAGYSFILSICLLYTITFHLNSSLAGLGILANNLSPTRMWPGIVELHGFPFIKQPTR